LIIIGGAAAALAYKASRTTSNIDTANALSIDFERAVKEAKKATGLEIPVSYAAIADGPFLTIRNGMITADIYWMQIGKD